MVAFDWRRFGQLIDPGRLVRWEAKLKTIYKVCGGEEWQSAVRDGAYTGSADDRRDGFIHFSTAGQLSETLAKHFAGQGDLVLVSVGTVFLGDLLRWEPSRGGALFPHLYGPLDMTAVLRIDALPLQGDGSHDISKHLPELRS